MSEQERPGAGSPGTLDATGWCSMGATEDEVIREGDAITPEVTDIGLDERGRDQPNGIEFGRGEMPDQLVVGEVSNTGGTPDMPRLSRLPLGELAEAPFVGEPSQSRPGSAHLTPDAPHISPSSMMASEHLTSISPGIGFGQAGDGSGGMLNVDVPAGSDVGLPARTWICGSMGSRPPWQRSRAMSDHPPTEPTEPSEGMPAGAAAPSDAGGPDLFGVNTGPMSASPSETERELVEREMEASASSANGGSAEEPPASGQARARLRGSAAPEHDVGASPAVEPAGPHGWPLPAGGAPSVTGEPDAAERGGAGPGQLPEAGLPKLHDVPRHTP